MSEINESSKSDSTVLKSIILPRRPVKNGQPSIVDGGDCGACVVCGLLGGMDAGWTVEQVYDELHRPGTYYGGKPIEKRSSLSRRTMVDTLKVLASDSGCRGGLTDVPVLLDHVIDDVPIWPFDQHESQLCFGLRAQFEWRSYARAMLNGGYYGVAQVKHSGYDPEAPIRTHGTTDHWVLLCGWRYVFVPEADPERLKLCTGHYEEHILVGDSSRARPLETWVDLNDFQRFWGGFAAIWARPLVQS